MTGDYRLRCELLVRTPLEETFEVFQNPYNLAKITPPWLKFKITADGLEMRKGLEIKYRFRWLGIPLGWTTIITEYDPPHRFVDEMLRGPYQLWRHTHSFAPQNGGTLVRDEVEYSLPFGPLGRLAHWLVARQLKTIFNYRQAALAKMLGAPEHQQPPVIGRIRGGRRATPARQSACVRVTGEGILAGTTPDRAISEQATDPSMEARSSFHWRPHEAERKE